MISTNAGVRVGAALGLTACLTFAVHPAVAQTARPELAQPRVVESYRGRFEGQVEAWETAAEVGGFGEVDGLYLYGFTGDDAVDPEFDLCQTSGRSSRET